MHQYGALSGLTHRDGAAQNPREKENPLWHNVSFAAQGLARFLLNPRHRFSNLAGTPAPA